MKKDVEKDAISLLKTPDGSYTLLNENLGETYHSRYGALTESQYVYIRQGLEFVAGLRNISVLEVGFGTGLNAWLSWLYGEKNKLHLRYLAIEPFPLKKEICIRPDLPDEPREMEWNAIQDAAWNKEAVLSPHFTLHKIKDRIEEFPMQAPRFHLVYFDAFAPNYQPEIWNASVFSRLHAAMFSGAVLVTYCAKGDVRRTLQNTGFAVERLAGPPGKREMLRATRL